ncbi:hypothetical protein RCL1_008473 [Eukaryota sp. TZLM3-RCL]
MPISSSNISFSASDPPSLGCLLSAFSRSADDTQCFPSLEPATWFLDKDIVIDVSLLDATTFISVTCLAFVKSLRVVSGDQTFDATPILTPSYSTFRFIFPQPVSNFKFIFSPKEYKIKLFRISVKTSDYEPNSPLLRSGLASEFYDLLPYEMTWSPDFTVDSASGKFCSNVDYEEIWLRNLPPVPEDFDTESYDQKVLVSSSKDLPALRRRLILIPPLASQKPVENPRHVRVFTEPRVTPSPLDSTEHEQGYDMGDVPVVIHQVSECSSPELFSPSQSPEPSPSPDHLFASELPHVVSVHEHLLERKLSDLSVNNPNLTPDLMEVIKSEMKQLFASAMTCGQ